MSTCEQERGYQVVHKNVRTRDDELAGTSEGRHYDYAISKSSVIDSYKTISNEELIHEHNFVQVTPKNRQSFVRCLTCGANFCKACGKVLGDGHVHTDSRKCVECQHCEILFVFD